MRRLTVLATALCVALLTGTGAFAQVPPADPNNPNETVPDQLNPTPYGEPIGLDNPQKVAAAPAAKGTKGTWQYSFCITIADPHGEPVYLERGANCQLPSIAISQPKARAAARYRRPTLAFE